MKSPIKLENDWHEYSKVEKVILAVVLALVVLVVISWAEDGFASNEKLSREHHSDLSHSFGYGASVTLNLNHSKDEHNKIWKISKHHIVRALYLIRNSRVNSTYVLCVFLLSIQILGRSSRL